METVAYLGLGMGLAWVSGINLYATVATLGILNYMGYVVLPEQLAPLADPGVIAIASFMYVVEFFADKFPGLDSLWDTAHTFIRIPAGAILAAKAVAPVSEEAELIAFLLGGAVAASSHFTKTAGRVAINASPEPVSNWIVSISEDVSAMVALWVAFNHPHIMLGFVLAFFLASLWLAPKFFRLFKSVVTKIIRILRPESTAPFR